MNIYFKITIFSYAYIRNLTEFHIDAIISIGKLTCAIIYDIVIYYLCGKPLQIFHLEPPFLINGRTVITEKIG